MGFFFSQNLERAGAQGALHATGRFALLDRMELLVDPTFTPYPLSFNNVSETHSIIQMCTFSQITRM
jgi:hypothetical protein